MFGINARFTEIVQDPRGFKKENVCLGMKQKSNDLKTDLESDFSTKTKRKSQVYSKNSQIEHHHYFYFYTLDKIANK